MAEFTDNEPFQTATDADRHAGEMRSGIMNETGPASRFPEAEPDLSAAQRLRAFEDKHLGEDAPRISGKLERGHGSLFSRLTDDQKSHHGKLEKLVDSERKVADATAHLEAAKIAHDAALDASRIGSG